MRTVLHIITRPDDALAREMIARQKGNPNYQVRVTDLTPPAPNYDALLREIFAADSVAVW